MYLGRENIQRQLVYLVSYGKVQLKEICMVILCMSFNINWMLKTFSIQVKN